MFLSNKIVFETKRRRRRRRQDQYQERKSHSLVLFSVLDFN